jgi:hypothetical protein
MFSGLLSSAESLFSYRDGKKHKDFVDVTYVPMFVDELSSLFTDKTLEIHAKEACGDVIECMFDIAASGSLSFGNSTKESVKHYNKRKKDINTGNTKLQKIFLLICFLFFLKNPFFLFFQSACLCISTVKACWCLVRAKPVITCVFQVMTIR